MFTPDKTTSAPEVNPIINSQLLQRLQNAEQQLAETLGRLEVTQGELQATKVELVKAKQPCSSKVAGVEFASKYGYNLSFPQGVRMVTQHWENSSEASKKESLDKFVQDPQYQEELKLSGARTNDVNDKPKCLHNCSKLN